MVCGKCGKYARLCPFSFGLALGITCGIAVLIMAAMVMNNMASPEMETLQAHLTWSIAVIHSLWAILKGFVFGFVLVLIYNLIQKIGAKCCASKSSDEKCGCELSKKE